MRVGLEWQSWSDKMGFDLMRSDKAVAASQAQEGRVKKWSGTAAKVWPEKGWMASLGLE
jgi:hypothetical protein